jgi:hypothetical protein
MKARENETYSLVVDLADVSIDMKRVLRVQIKELVHRMEDAEYELEHSFPSIQSSRLRRNYPIRHSNVA